MRGLILNTVRVRDEDLIVKIITNTEVLSLYRFYGARHSYINTGYFIDFVVEENYKSTIKRLRNVAQISFKFLFEREKLFYFKEYVRLLNIHFTDVSRVDNFYYDSLFRLAESLHQRDAKRAIIEHYVGLLEKEGRLYKDKNCFLCEKKVGKKIALARSFLVAHEKCIMSDGFDAEKIDILFNEKKTILFNDEEIEKLWKILSLGI
ncbi:recombination protein RecO [Lebetimonas sp. JH292]|uniref:recombination protein RecO n=1 Tax=Lebetimonas sp. JH292 TaxID=990068 RepID=UPI000466F1DA|nr:recombination protein RecO [Lebetimonas sp. JH292]